MKITALAARRPLSTAAVVLTVLVLGLYGLARLPVDFLPDVTYPLVRIHVYWPGAMPGEIERELAEPIERQMSTVDGLDYLESSSIEGMYTLLANFKYGADVDVAYQDSLAAMARAARDLPTDIEPPIVIKADPSQLPVLQLTVRSDDSDEVKLAEWVDNWLRDRLVAVPGVAGAELVGGQRREVRVLLDPGAIERHRLDVGELQRRIGRENVESSAGRITSGPRELIARTVGEFASPAELENVVVARDGDARLLLRDVATVEDGHEEVRVITRLDGRPAVKLSILKQADANTVEVARAVEERLAELRPALPKGVHLGIVENQADYVESALDGVRNAALEAAVLVVLLMALFLGSWRQVVAMVWALPFTLIANFGLMELAGFSLNIFSIGGLVIAIAVDLDNSIIVIENITRLRRERPELGSIDLVVMAVHEVGPAVLASTLSFLALFLPFLMVPGLSTLLFRELILVVAGVMGVSFVNAIVVTPAIMALLLRGAGRTEHESLFERWVGVVRARYVVSLEAVLRRPRTTIAGFVVLLGVAALVVPWLGSEFLPRIDDGRVMVKVRLPTGASLARTDEALRRVEAAVGDDPLVESAFTLAGGRVWGLYTYLVANEGELDLQLVPRGRREVTTDEYVEDLRRRLASVRLPAGKAMAMPMKMKGIRSTGQSELEVKIRGPETERLFHLAGQIAAAAEADSPVRNVYVSVDMTKPEYQILPDRFRIAGLGLSVAEVADTLRTLVRGDVVSRLRAGDEYDDIRMLVPERLMSDRASLGALPVSCTPGGCIRVSDLAAVEEAVGPVEIARENQVKQVVIQADADGVSPGEALEGLRDRLASIELPPGYEVSYGGQASLMADARRDLLLVLAFSLLFAFAILVLQFNQLRVPALILLTVPFSVAGLIIALGITGTPLGATVMIGLLVVVAAHSTEGVLLLSYAEELRGRDGRSRADAVVLAANTRFRPRIMTALGVVVGLLPVALNLEDGGDMLQPLATGAIGGVLAGILVALYLMPTLYAASWRFGRRSPSRVPDVPIVDSIRATG